jgi:type IV pilus assembly protein PilV
MTNLFNNKGTSLLEVMAAMLVLAIGIMGIAPLMVVTSDSNSFSRELTRANTLASDKIEELRAGGGYAPLPYIRNEINIENKYNRTIRIDAYESDITVPPGVYRIHVTMNWTDQNGLPRSTEYWTYTTRR